MTLLLDTHTLLWFLTNNSRLSARSRGAIEDPANVAHVSAVSLWEVAIKVALGRLRLPASYADIFPSQIETNGFGLLPITAAHCATLLSLPMHHRDPFDRLLLAQARTDGMTLVTDDGQFAPYGVALLW